MGDLSKAEIKELAKEGFVDPVFFCKGFLGHIFTRTIPHFHRGLLAVATRRSEFLPKYGEVDWLLNNFVVRDRNGKITKSIFSWSGGKLRMDLSRNTLIMMHRGGSKTTIAGQAVPIIKVCYGDVKFLCYISEAAPHAEMQLAAVKRELEDNKKIEAVFGKLKPENNSSKAWRSDLIETTTGVTLAAKGSNAQIRGMNNRAQRPDELLFDDVESSESVSTPEQLKKMRQWAYSDAMPAIDEINGGTMTALGTTLHPNSLLETWARDPEWTVIRLGAVDVDGAAIWPDQLSLEKLEVKKNSYALVSELDKYYMEYHNEYRAPETQLFKAEFFKSAPQPPLHDHYLSIYLDPAISERPEADTSVIVAAAMSPKGQILLLEDFGIKTKDQRLVIDKYFEISKKYSALCPRINHGIEAIAFQRVLVHLMQEEMFRRKHYFEIQAVTHTNQPKTKQDRIKGMLLPRFASGYVTFCCDAPDMMNQLMDFGRSGVHDDHPDAFAGAVALLDPFAPAAAGDFDLTKDSYPPLDEVIGGSFHAI